MALIQCRHPPQCFSGARGHGGLSTAGTINAHCHAMRLQRCLSTAFAATGHPALRPNSLARALPNTPFVGTGPLTPLKALIALIQWPSSPSVFQWCQGKWRAFNGGNAVGHPALRPHSLARTFNPPLGGTGPLTPLKALIALWCQGTRRAVNGGDDECSLLRCVLATTSIHSICGCGPSGPAPTFAGASFTDTEPLGT
jgi:hypothetical protein